MVVKQRDSIERNLSLEIGPVSQEQHNHLGGPPVLKTGYVLLPLFPTHSAILLGKVSTHVTYYCPKRILTPIIALD